MTAARDKGTAFETAIVRWLRDNGFPHAERRASHGTRDLGDVTGIPGVVIEIKNKQRMALAEWVEEAAQEGTNAGADVWAVVHKQRGTGNPAWSYATMSVGMLAYLLRLAGFGDEL